MQVNVSKCIASTFTNMSMNSVTKLQSKRFYVVMSYVILLQNLLNLL